MLIWFPHYAGWQDFPTTHIEQKENEPFSSWFLKLERIWDFSHIKHLFHPFLLYTPNDKLFWCYVCLLIIRKNHKQLDPHYDIFAKKSMKWFPNMIHLTLLNYLLRLEKDKMQKWKNVLTTGNTFSFNM